MRRLLLIILGLIFGSAGAGAQVAAITGNCIVGASQAQTQGLKSSNFQLGAIPNCTVQVFLTGTTTPATIFSDSLQTPLGNPFTLSGGKSQWLFFAAINRGYDVVMSGGIAPNTFPAPVTLVGLYPAQQIISTGASPAGPAFAVNFANSFVNAFQGDSSITIDPTTHTFTAPNVVLTGVSGSTPVCPNGPGGALTNIGCTGGAAGNPAPPSFAVQSANSGATSFQADSSILINPTTHSFQAPIANGFANAIGYGNGSTNGISACVAAGLSSYCIAGPTYPPTEQYTQASPIPNWPSNFVFRDQRPGSNLYLYHNPTLNATYGDTNNPSEQHLFYRDGTLAIPGGQTSLKLFDFSIVDNVTLPGFSYGNATVGPTGWMIPAGLVVSQFVNGEGISEAINTDTFKYAPGDTVGVYCQANGRGGSIAKSDEGTKACSGSTTEIAGLFSAPCTTGCTAGSTAIKVTTANCPPTFGGQCTMGTGMPLLDTTAGPTTTTASAIAASGLSSSISAVTVAATVPISVAWGTLASNVAPVGTTIPPFTQSLTFNVTLTSGTFTAPSLGCFASQTQEQAAITAVGTPSGGVQSVTVSVHSGHSSGSFFFQGGMCGNGINFTAYNQTNGGTLRYLLDVVGSTDAHTLQVIRWFNGVGSQITQAGELNAGNQITGSINLSSLSSSVNTVTATYGGGTLTIPSQYGGSTFVITGASDAAFNTSCTSAVWTNPNTLTCTIAGIGTHTAVSATASLGLNTVELWPWTVAWDVQNEATTPPVMDGTMTLAPHNIQFAASDTLTMEHHEAGQFSGARFQDVVDNPYNTGFGLLTSIQGGGAHGGSLSLGGLAVMRIGVSQPDTYFMGTGGFHFAPNLFDDSGLYYIAHNHDHGPQTGSPGYIVIRPFPSQVNDVNYCFNFFNFYNASSNNNMLNNCPSSGNMTWTLGSGTLTFRAPKIDFSSVGNLVLPIITVSTPGGFVSGQGENYAPYSQNIAGPTWRNTGGGSGTTTCAINDDLGNPACTLTGTAAYNWTDNLSTTGYTPLTLGTTYFVHARMQGAVGGETVQLGTNFLASNLTLTSSWAEYCATVVASNSGTPALTNFAGINLTSSETINVSTLTVSPLSCGPPLATTNNQFTTPTIANHANTFDFSAITLNGNAVSTPEGIPVLIDKGTAVMTTAAITAPACGTTVTVVSANVLTTDTIQWSFNVAPAGTNAGLVSWPTAGNVNFAYCPGVTETPAAATINWKVMR